MNETTTLILELTIFFILYALLSIIGGGFIVSGLFKSPRKRGFGDMAIISMPAVLILFGLIYLFEKLIHTSGFIGAFATFVVLIAWVAGILSTRYKNTGIMRLTGYTVMVFLVIFICFMASALSIALVFPNSMSFAPPG